MLALCHPVAARRLVTRRVLASDLSRALEIRRWFRRYATDDQIPSRRHLAVENVRHCAAGVKFHGIGSRSLPSRSEAHSGAFSVLIESEPRLYFHVLTRFRAPRTVIHFARKRYGRRRAGF